MFGLAFRIERATCIEAPLERVFALVDDFRRWSAWSPFEQHDRATTRTFDGAPNGKGAVYAWSGAGRARKLDSAPSARVKVEVDSNTAEFTFRTVGNATRVTWSLQAPHPFFGRVLESGLASLKAAAER